MTIGVAIIAKNESALIARCLSSVKDADEIVVVDTGSTDNTIEIAKKFTPKVYSDFTWNDHFAQARNHIKSKMTTDWILSIDVDEILVDFTKVREAVALAEQKGIKSIDVCLIKEEDEESIFYFPRLFKNVPEVFWEGAIHNTVSIIGAKIGDVRIKIGFSPAHLQDRDRAYRILKKQMEINPSPRNMYYLGREYAYRGEHEECISLLFQYVQQSYFPAEKADAYLIMAQSLWALKQVKEAKDACMNAILINPNFKEACKYMADIMRKERNPNWESNVHQWEKMAETADNKEVLFIRRPQ